MVHSEFPTHTGGDEKLNNYFAWSYSTCPDYALLDTMNMTTLQAQQTSLNQLWQVLEGGIQVRTK